MNYSCILLFLLLFCNNCEKNNERDCECYQHKNRNMERKMDSDCGCMKKSVSFEGPSYYAREKMEDKAKTVRAIDRDCGCQATSEEV